MGVLLEGLRTAGETVTELNVPLDLDTADRVRMLRRPWRVPLLAVKLARCWLRLLVRARRYRRGRPVDAVLVGYLGHFDVRLARWLFRSRVIVLDHLVSAVGTARDRGLAGGGLKERLLRAIDVGAVGRADVVVVDTRENAANLPPPARSRSLVVPVGAGTEWFAARGRAAVNQPAEGGRPPLRAIFVGVFTPLHGTPTIGAALGLLAPDEGIAVTVVGTGQDYAACRRAADNPRVTWVDWVPAAQLPDLVATHDVCLGIFGTTAKARAVVPNKVYQGAAAGCAVITSDTAPQREAFAGAAVFVPAGDADALAAALRGLAADRGRLDQLRAAAAARAAAYAPATVAGPLRERVAAVLDARRRAIPRQRTRNHVPK
jgi:glycosyltransferase involved in cell wall biosynthesis